MEERIDQVQRQRPPLGARLQLFLAICAGQLGLLSLLGHFRVKLRLFDCAWLQVKVERHKLANREIELGA